MPGIVSPGRTWRATALLSLGLVGAAVAADGARGPMARSPELNFSLMLQQALQRAPEYLELAARDEEARLHVAAARSWIAGRPSMEASYLDDRPRSALGVTELEYGVQFPLWRRGERKDAALLGENLGAQTSAWKSYLELTLAGRVRQSLVDLDSADRLLAIERQATAEVRRMLESIEKLFDAGEAAQMDVAQTRTLLLNQQRKELQAATALANAESAYSLLTGLAARPATAHREQAAPRNAIDADHPWLRLLASGVAVAEDAVRRTRQEAKGSPSVMVGARRQRGGEGEDYNDSLLVSLSVPFGGSAHVGSRVSSVKRQKAEAEIQFKTAQNELTRRLRELQHEQEQTRAALRLSEEQVALDRRQWEMAQSAFELGELTLFQVLAALRQSGASTLEHEILKLRSESLVIQFNQSVGVLP
jgi:cobalt-zinc-cadmium efflux system outer membrane protein